MVFIAHQMLETFGLKHWLNASTSNLVCIQGMIFTFKGDDRKLMPKHIAWDYTVDNYQIYPISDEGEKIMSESTVVICAIQTEKNSKLIQAISGKIEEACELIGKIEGE